MFAHTRPRHIVIVVFACLTTEFCLAGAGDLDPTFGDAGLVTTDFGTTRDLAHAVAVQADGKIVVVGSTSVSDFAVARYNADGSLDSSFGSDGLVTTDFGGADHAFGVAIQDDGKIVVVGRSTHQPDTGEDFALARYNPDGSLDSSFGSDGLVTTDFGTQDCPTCSLDHASSVAIQSDGKIVAAGFSLRPDNTGLPAFALARYNPDGSLDTHFGCDGLITTNFPGVHQSIASSLAIQDDGKIVAAGFSSQPDGEFDFALARYNANNGSLDSSFGSDGLVTTDFGLTFDVATSIAIQDDGKIVAVGYSTQPGTFNDFALARYNADGSLDSSFGSGGLVTTAFGSNNDRALSVAIQADGKIVAAGLADGDFALARYLPDGSPDGSFGAAGLVTTDFGLTSDAATSVAIQSDGKIVAAGTSRSGSGFGERDFALARYEVDITTAVGSNVVVQPNDPTTGESPVTMTFDQVDQAGTTTVITSETGPTPPTGFRLASDPPTFYEITTTAVFSGSIEVCIDYSGLNLTAPETSLSLMHFEDGEWMDATTSLDTINDIICGTVSSLSPFVIMENLGLVELLLSLGQAVADLNLQQGIDNSLDAKLDSALQALQDINQNNDVAAINSLNAFINAVLAQSGNQISMEDGDQLIATAQAIMALLG